MKPTYGRVSRFGLIAYASSLDQIGPMTRSVEDAARLLNVLAGPCEHDMTSMDVPVEDWTAALGRGVQGLKVGVPREYFGADIQGLTPEVRASVQTTLERLEKEGATIQEVSLPHTSYAIATYYLIATAEASSNLARFDGVRYGHRADCRDLASLYEKSRSEGFGEEVKRRIMLGTYVLSAGFYDAYYRKAQQVRTLITRDFQNVFQNVDVLITPTTPSPAFRIGEKTSDPLQMYLEDIFTISCNLAGLPGISVPGPTHGLPMGIQVLAPHFREDLVFQTAAAIERAGVNP
jgi:aspartyl-tRNA(Asn)/glutamyl-tRNA(Gln) amidotransferase subunit A